MTFALTATRGFVALALCCALSSSCTQRPAATLAAPERPVASTLWQRAPSDTRLLAHIALSPEQAKEALGRSPAATVALVRCGVAGVGVRVDLALSAGSLLADVQGLPPAGLRCLLATAGDTPDLTFTEQPGGGVLVQSGEPLDRAGAPQGLREAMAAAPKDATMAVSAELGGTDGPLGIQMAVSRGALTLRVELGPERNTAVAQRIGAALERARAGAPVLDALRVRAVERAVVIEAPASDELAAAIKRHLAETFRTPSVSMMPALLPGDLFLVEKTAEPPRVGEIIVFDSPDEPGQAFVKRVIATAGQRVSWQDGALAIDDRRLLTETVPDHPVLAELNEGRALRESSRVVMETLAGRRVATLQAKEPFPARTADVTVRDGHVYVLGDNRDQSLDSRHFGPVPVASVTGRARLVLWSSGSAARWSRIGARLD